MVKDLPDEDHQGPDECSAKDPSFASAWLWRKAILDIPVQLHHQLHGHRLKPSPIVHLQRAFISPTPLKLVALYQDVGSSTLQVVPCNSAHRSKPTALKSANDKTFKLQFQNLLFGLSIYYFIRAA